MSTPEEPIIDEVIEEEEESIPDENLLQFIVQMHLGNYEDKSLANLSFFVISKNDDQIVFRIANRFRELVRIICPQDPLAYVQKLFEMANHQLEESDWLFFQDNGLLWYLDKGVPVKGLITLHYIEDWVADDYNDRYAFKDLDNISEDIFHYDKFR